MNDLTINGFKAEAMELLSKGIDDNFLSFGCEIIALSAIDKQQAFDIFRNIIEQQQDNGRLPHPIFSEMTVPPVFGYILLEIRKTVQDQAVADAFCQEMYPKIQAFHNYLYTQRDFEEEGLIFIKHPAESNLLNSPTFDDLDLSKFSVQEPLFNACLSKSNEAMIELGRIIKTDVTDFVLWNELTVYSMNEKLWDESQGIYNSYDLTANKTIAGETLAGLLPIISNIPTQAQAENILLNLEDEFFGGSKEALMYLCPTYDVTTKDIDFEKAQRGAVHPELNWLLYHALQKFDMTSMASKVLTDTLNLMKLYGFQSHFDPRNKNGKKIGKSENQTSAAVYLRFLKEINEI